jgi:uncharacterized cofD-like protein
MTSSRRVVALGGGHGTAVTLRALSSFCDDIVAIVSVADDGGSSGRLRELLGVPALGDLRKCLVALAPDSPLSHAMEVRYQEGELAGHVLGNLLLAGLVDAAGDLVDGIDEAHRLLACRGRVLPATTTAVTLQTRVGERIAIGQVAVGSEAGIEDVALMPATAPSPPAALEAIADADQIVIGPGSLYTSVIAAAIAPEILAALNESPAQKVYVCNLRPQDPESAGHSVHDHLEALFRHGVPVDLVLCDLSQGMVLGVPPRRVVEWELAGRNGKVHDPEKLAHALRRAFERGSSGGSES